jgi:NTP pyrophosphatase (non-canonical NTP hydrolase)
MPKQIKSIHRQILDASKKEPKPIIARMVKLQEECGELAVAVLKKEGWKGLGKDTKDTNHDNILEEGCDVMIIVMSVLAKYKFTEEQINDKLQAKLNKWMKLINSVK